MSDTSPSPGAGTATAATLESGGGERDRSRALVEAAYQLLDESGLEGLTIRSVLARTGLARRAFYDRFQGKDDLVLAVFENSLRAAAVHFERITRHRPSALEALHDIVSGIVVGQLDTTNAAIARRGAALSREHLRLAQSRPEELQKVLQPLLDVIASHIVRGIATGELRDADPQTQARLLYNLVSNTVQTVLLSEEGAQADRLRRDRLGQDLWEFCRRALIA